MIALKLSHDSVLHSCSCLSIPDKDEDLNPTSASLEVLLSSDSSSDSEDMDAAAELLFNVEDFEYEDEDDEEYVSFDDEESSDDEGGVRRRYLRANANGMGSRRLTRYKCNSSCRKKCRNSNRNRNQCKKRCCRPTGAGQASASASGGNKPADRANGILGTYNYLPPSIVGGGPLPYCPNFTMHTTGMGPCMATQFPIPGVSACPSGTIGFSGGAPCVVW